MRYIEILPDEKTKTGPTPEKFSDLPDYEELIQKDRIIIRDRGLKSLEGCPETLTTLICPKNKLTNFIGGPKEIKDNFFADQNPFTSFLGSPEIVGREYAVTVNGNRMIQSLEGLPKRADTIVIPNTIVTCANANKYIEHVNAIHFDFRYDMKHVPSHLLSLLLIPGIKNIVFDDHDHPLSVIMNKHIGTGRKGLMACQAELMKAGFPQQAKL